MRITTNMMYDRNLTSLMKNSERFSKALEQMNTLEKFSTAGESPNGMAQKLNLTAEIAKYKQYAANGTDLQAKLTQQETTLDSIHTSLDSAYTKVQQAVNGTNNNLDRETLASELEELQKQLYDLMNAQDENGEHLFAGNQSQTQPFTKDSNGNYIYQGDNGQRFSQYHDDFVSLAPNATVLELDPRDGQPFDAELKRQVTVLGEVFGKQAEAKKLGEDLDAAIARVKAAYKPEDTVMAVITSGGEIGYVVPGTGRTLGPVFDFAGLTPALEVAGSDDHQGDDISVEAIADSNPNWILVMDRDAAVSADDPSYKPANEILESSEALANVPAVQNSQIIYMPADTYTNEGIQTYIEFLNTFADALEKAK